MTDQVSAVHQNRAARFKLLTETSSGTSMGKLLRQFWHPVAISSSVKTGHAREIRVLGEDLALYRGASGKVHLVTNKCAHRGTKLHTGWVEEENIRCMYHGWKYDGTGICVERPAETKGGGGICIAAYPVYEYLGLIFAYLGPGEAPEFDLLRKPKWEGDDVLVFQRMEIWPCNWFQCVENSLDAVHVSFAHQIGKVGVFGEEIKPKIPELSYEETDAGIRQTAVRRFDGKVQRRISDWTFPYGNQIALPNVEKGLPWVESANWMMPIDDHYTMRINMRAAQRTTDETDAEQKAYFDDCAKYSSADFHDELFTGNYPDDPLVKITSAQDYIALVGQGAIADRMSETLGSSDMGIATLRRIFYRELDAMAEDRPTKAWRRLDSPPQLIDLAEEL